MATHSSLTNNAFSFGLFEAGMATNARLNLATAKWQLVITADVPFTQIEITDLRVAFVSPSGAEDVVIGNVDADGLSPLYVSGLYSFPDLSYVEGTNELETVVVLGTFSYKPDSANPEPGAEIGFALRYNSTGDEDSGLLELGGDNDPSGEPTDYTEYNGSAFFCPLVKQQSVFIRFGPEKIKFHRFYARVTPSCIPAGSLPIV
jgi:hypothetical protein